MNDINSKNNLYILWIYWEIYKSGTQYGRSGEQESMRNVQKRRQKTQKNATNEKKENYPKKINGKMIEWGRINEDASLILLCF